MDEEIFMICNPPYGERIKIQGKRGQFLSEAWNKFLTIDQPLRFGWLLPSDMDDLFQNPKGYKLSTKRHLKNGGLAVTFWIWIRE
jgi:23S rRNA G2445 N2-methylase RlmL